MALTDFLTSIADAIRYAEGSTGEINAQKFAERIRALSGSQPISPILSSIIATKTKTTYNIGDIFEYSDVTVTAVYSDSTTKNVTSSSIIDTENVNMNEANTFGITISYTENGITKATSINITVSEVTPEPSPVVPQIGTWQLKSTTDKKYIILGTDDDNIGNPKYFRLLRTYGFPYTMNTAAESVSAVKDLGSDVDDTIFTDSDAPALFTDGVDVVTFGKYLHDSGLGEVAQHGASSKVLWDSDRLTGDFLTSLHEAYVEQGGTKTEEELKTAIMEQLASTDGSQGAVYVDNSRDTLEQAYGFPIYTVGAWGGVPSAIVDGIECSMNSIKGTSNYNWRAKNYTAVGSVIGGGVSVVTNGTTLYNLYRNATGLEDAVTEINNTKIGKSLELFWHMPFNDEPDISKWRTLFDYIKGLVDNGKAEVVTRKQYAELGEYVENPIVSLSLIRDGSLNVGDNDTDEAYTITATYEDGSTENVKSEAILDRSAVNTEKNGTYTVYAYYRGFTATSNIVVMSSNYILPESLKSVDTWFVFSNDSTGVWYCGNYSKSFVNAIKSDNKILQFIASEGSGKINGWKSTDNGATWEQVTTNRTAWNTTISTNRTSDADGGYQFAPGYNATITWLETSGNFTIEY